MQGEDSLHLPQTWFEAQENVGTFCALLQLKPIPHYTGDPLPQSSGLSLTSNSGLLLGFLLGKKEIRSPAATAD